MYLGGLTNFSKSQKNRGARRQSYQQLKRMTPNIDDKVTNVGKSTKFPYYGRQMPRNEQYSFLQDLGNTPNSACCERRTKKNWESLLHCSAAWQVSWLNTISPLKFPQCDWRLHFHAQFISFPVWYKLILQPIFSSQNKNWSVMRPGPNQ